MIKNKIIKEIPILILSSIIVYTWIIIMSTNYYPTIKHKIGLCLFIVISILYFLKFKYGIISTGMFLILASLNIVAIFPKMISTSYFVKIGEFELSIPPLQLKSILLLIIFFICTGNYLKEIYSTCRQNRKLKQ